MAFQTSSQNDLEKRIKRLEEKFEQLTIMIQQDIRAKKDQESKKEKKKKDAKKKTSKSEKVVADKEVDFTIITGLGEKMAQFLLQEGVSSYQQLSTLSVEMLETLNQKKKGFASRYKRFAWKNQAAELAKQ